MVLVIITAPTVAVAVEFYTGDVRFLHSPEQPCAQSTGICHSPGLKAQRFRARARNPKQPTTPNHQTLNLKPSKPTALNHETIKPKLGAHGFGVFDCRVT